MAELSKKIMRRVYYVFFLRQISHPVFVHVTLLIVSVYALSRVVSIPNVLANLLETKVGELATYLLGALISTQAVTIVWLFVITVTLVSLAWRLLSGRRSAWRADEESWA